MNKLLENRRKRIPLKIRIEVAIQAYFIAELCGSYFMPVDEESEEYKKLSEINQKAFDEANPLIEIVMEEVSEWVKDGMPKNKLDES